jgi:nitroreductase
MATEVSRVLRVPEAGVDSSFVDRWSPRSFHPEPVDPDAVQALFEAARWSPSASNLQPWLFVYADNDETLERVRPIVRDGNRRWSDRAPLLVFIFARRNNPKTGEPNRLAAFDTGAAWMALALQAAKLGLHTHAMGGIHPDRAHAILGVPEGEYECLCGVAIGKRAPAEHLPDDLRAREAPNERNSRDTIAHRGAYRQKG